MKVVPVFLFCKLKKKQQQSIQRISNLPNITQRATSKAKIGMHQSEATSHASCYFYHIDLNNFIMTHREGASVRTWITISYYYYKTA